MGRWVRRINFLNPFISNKIERKDFQKKIKIMFNNNNNKIVFFPIAEM